MQAAEEKTERTKGGGGGSRMRSTCTGGAKLQARGVKDREKSSRLINSSELDISLVRPHRPRLLAGAAGG